MILKKTNKSVTVKNVQELKKFEINSSRIAKFWTIMIYGEAWGKPSLPSN